MQFFSKIFTIVAVVALGVISSRAQTLDTVTTAITTITDTSSGLQVTVASLNITNFPTSGGKIATGLNNIISITNEFIQDITVPNPTTFGDSDAQTIVDALTDLVKVHQFLLSTIIGKHSLAAQFFFTAPIAAALRSLESVIDTIALDIIALIPTQADAGQGQLTMLDASFSVSIQTYS